jgi:hypothetical protein
MLLQRLDTIMSEAGSVDAGGLELRPPVRDYGSVLGSDVGLDVGLDSLDGGFGGLNDGVPILPADENYFSSYGSVDQLC